MYQIAELHRRLNFSNHLLIIIALLIIWELVWKAVALWKAGHNNQLVWFVAMIVINSAGLLEIAYILCFQENRNIKPRSK